MSKDLMPKLKAAYENGRLDFLAGAPFDPKSPLVVYDYLPKEDQSLVVQAWIDGWQEAERAA